MLSGLSFDEVLNGNEIIARWLKLYKQRLNGADVYLHNGMQSTELFFHSSLDWIGPVLDKIEKLGYDTSMIRRKVGDGVQYSFRIRQEGESNQDKDIYIIGTNRRIVLWTAVQQFCLKNPPKLNTLEL